MLLSLQQRYIVELLRQLGYARREQLLTLTRAEWPDLGITEARMDAMLRQLRSRAGNVFLEGGLVSLSRLAPDSLYLEAIDVMLELSGGRPRDIQAKLPDPFLLRFIAGDNDPRLFSVAALLPPAQPARAERRRMERIVWISNGGAPPPGLALPPKHFFAVRQEDGTHQFYGSRES